MIWGSIPNEERLRLWKSLRDDIKDLSVEKQLELTAKFCSTIPFGSRSLDYYSSEDWPTPWEILFHGTFCTSSISLLMFYTLILIPISVDIELILVEDDEDVYLLPVIDNHLVLNYELGQVNRYSEIADNFKTIKKYTRTDVKIT